MTFAVLGEALIDLIEDGSRAFNPFLGGSPFNVAIALAKQGAEVSYLSLLSDDQFGDRLYRALEVEGVNLPLPQRSSRPTSLALIAVDETGQPRYQFYREGVADKQTSLEDIVDNLSDDLSVFHTGSLAITPSQLPKIHALFDLMNQRGVTISVDINIRLGASSVTQKYLDGVWSLLAKADIVKASDEDIGAFSLSKDLHTAAQQMFEQMKSGLLIVTEGEYGVTAISSNGKIKQPAYAVKNLVDTVGAGDSFYAAFLAYSSRNDLLHKNSHKIISDNLQSALQFASAAAAINVGRAGCSPPDRVEIETFLTATK